MSYLHQNQTSTFKKFLLSTVVVSSVVCSSSAIFAMDDEEWETPISQKRIKSGQAAANLLCQSIDVTGHNGVLFEWKENEDKKAMLVHFEANEFIFNEAGNTLFVVAPKVITAIKDSTGYIDMFEKLYPVAEEVVGKDYSVKGITRCVLSTPNVKDYMEKRNWNIVGSWVKSAEDIKKGIDKTKQIVGNPPKYLLTAHLPYVNVNSEVHNSLTTSAALLYSSGIKDYHNVFVAASPRLWKPQDQ